MRLRFCQERQISTAGWHLRMTLEKDPAAAGSVRLELTLPRAFRRNTSEPSCGDGSVRGQARAARSAGLRE
jgi:hypothetical protein